MFSDHNGIKLGIKLRNKTENSPNIWKWNENKNTTYSNLGVLKGKFMPLNVYLSKEERSQNNSQNPTQITRKRAK